MNRSLSNISALLSATTVLAMCLLPGYALGQIDPASAGAETIGGISIGPNGSAFWDAIPIEVAEGSNRGDILWISERSDAPEGSMSWTL